MNTEMLWSAKGAITDLAILVTPIGWELVALPPPDTTLRANHVASATLRYSDCGSSEKQNEKVSVVQSGTARWANRPAVCATPMSQISSMWTSSAFKFDNSISWGCHRNILIYTVEKLQHGNSTENCHVHSANKMPWYLCVAKDYVKSFNQEEWLLKFHHSHLVLVILNKVNNN